MRSKLFLLFKVISIVSFSQSVQNNISGDGRMNTVLRFNGDIISNIKPDNIAGTPLLFDSWDTGYVKFNGNRIAHHVPLQFNLTDNTVYFQKDNNRYKFVDRVIEFSFSKKVNNEYQQFLFRSNYPLNGNYTDLVFYKVEAENEEVQFLKYCIKKIRENYVHNAPSEKEYHYREELFLYLTKSKSFHPVSNKKSILAALPQYRQRIEELCEKNKWSLKEPAQIAQLVRQLK
ncbi:hypothetical protein PDL71_16215 [Lacibacter sp. MH-610]|uniref:hypothetical protein n=1 Tax=Lacibacter sp. MH-610 TaxID=3020883 RepID=UPI0038914C71